MYTNLNKEFQLHEKYLPFLFVSWIMMLMSDDDTKRKFAVQLYCKLEESLVTLEFSTDRVTVDGVTRFDPDSEHPMNYGDGPIPLTAGSDKILWTGEVPESYWKPADQ